MCCRYSNSDFLKNLEPSSISILNWRVRIKVEEKLTNFSIGTEILHKCCFENPYLSVDVTETFSHLKSKIGKHAPRQKSNGNQS